MFTKCQFATALYALPFLLPAEISAQPRDLTPDEASSLVEQASKQGFRDQPEILDAYVEDKDAGARRGEATLISRPNRIGARGCIASTLLFVGLAQNAEPLKWEPYLEYLGYRYWPLRSNCLDRDLNGSIVLGSKVDSDGLERILGAAPQILRLAAGYLPDLAQRIEGGRISKVEIAWDRSLNVYLYEVQFTITQCLFVRANVRLRGEIEVTGATEILC
jgi:hypothetical protein